MEQTVPQPRRIGGLAGWIIATIQRYRAEGAAKKQTQVELRMLETLSLGGRRQIAVVVCDGQRYLVGMSADAVTAITPAQSGVTDVRPSSNHHFSGGF